MTQVYIVLAVITVTILTVWFGSFESGIVLKPETHLNSNLAIFYRNIFQPSQHIAPVVIVAVNWRLASCALENLFKPNFNQQLVCKFSLVEIIFGIAFRHTRMHVNGISWYTNIPFLFLIFVSQIVFWFKYIVFCCSLFNRCWLVVSNRFCLLTISPKIFGKLMKIPRRCGFQYDYIVDDHDIACSPMQTYE